MPKQPPRAQPRRTQKRPTTPPAPTPLLDQRQLDIVGLVLIAFGVLIAIPLWSAGAGGMLGEAVADGARLLLGTAALGAPLLALTAGLVAVSPISVSTSVRIGAGGLAGFGAVALIARAAAGPDQMAVWSATHLRAAGGAFGELLWSLCHAAFGSFGPYVTAVVLILVAALLLTGAQVASVARGTGRGLARAVQAPARIREQRRADRAMQLGPHNPAVVRAEGGPQWEGPGSWHATEPSATASASRVPAAGEPARKRGRRRAATPPQDDLPQPPDAPRTWTSRADDRSRAGDTGSSLAPLAPPELPGVDPVVRRAARPVQLIDGAQRFPDLFGQEGPVWIGPELDGDHPAPAADVPYPDPLAEFEAELSSARHEAGLEVDEQEPGDEIDLPLERNGEFADDEPERYDPTDDDFGIDAVPSGDDRFDAEVAAEADVPGRPAPTGPQALTPMGRYRAEVTDSPEFEWRIPPRRFLTRSPKERGGPSRIDQQQTSELLLEALGHFGVKAELVGCVAGPHITRYELRLAPGVKMNKVAGLKDDLAYALAAVDIRILAPIPGKTAVGVEVPNRNRAMVRLGDVFGDAPPKASPLNVWLGKDVEGESIFVDLAKMPHLLVAGTTGAGKSACINGMLSSILLSASPHDVRMVLVDPKQVELTPYESIPHLLTPVITSPKMAATALQNLVREMEARYSTMALARTRNLPELNRVRRERGEAEFPYILCVIDELADLMMVAPGDVEDSIIRIAQKARAVGIHLVLATQSPRV
ncbi:MAG: DNA translocase FtsK, partial [Patulibacter sp.]